MRKTIILVAVMIAASLLSISCGAPTATNNAAVNRPANAANNATATAPAANAAAIETDVKQLANDGVAALLKNDTAALERMGYVDRFLLPPLDEADIDDLLKRMRVAPRETFVRRLQELTAGTPFLLAELLSSGPLERITSEWSSPPRVRPLFPTR